MSKEEIKAKIKQAIERGQDQDAIKKVLLFGSYLHGDARPDSDVDVLIEFKPLAKVGYFKLIDIQDSLEKNVGKRIDLLTPGALSKYFKNKVLAEAEVIYEG
jgi:uncharacterized protein